MTSTSSLTSTATPTATTSQYSNSSLPTTGLLTSAGIGSGLNVSQLVTELVAADAAPGNAQIQAQQTQISSQLSAVGTLQGAVVAFQTAVNALKTQSAFSAVTATSSSPTNFTASAAQTASTGNYSVQVNKLAASQQLVSTPFAAGSTAAVGTGTLTLTQGTNSFDVSIDTTDNTLAGIASAINGATGNPGINASVVQTTGGARLMLASTATGAAAAFTVTAAGGDGGLAPITYPVVAPQTGLTQIQAAQDADVTVSTLDVTSASNTIANAIPGVTLNLLATSSAAQALTVATDTTATTSKITDFVSAYNTLQSAMANLGGYNAASKTAGPLLGDPLLLGLQGQLQNGLFQSVTGIASGAANSLATIGITPDANGQLQVDSATLQNALATNYSGVSAIFGSTHGVAATLSKTLNTFLAPGGPFASRTSSLNTQMTGTQNAQTQLDQQMAIVQARYQAQFGALDTLLSKLQSTSSFLSSQLQEFTNSALTLSLSNSSG